MDNTDSAEEIAATPAKPWLDMIADATVYFQNYQDKCDSIDKLYADLKTMASGGNDRQFQIFWANLEVLKPSIYARPPVPVVVPRHKDFRELPRQSSVMLERALLTSFDLEDFNSTMIQVRDDLAISSRGAIWLRYEATGDDADFVEKVCYDHVDRKDFLHDPARKWKEVDWVAKRAWLTRKQGLKRFGDAWLTAEFKEHAEHEEYKGEKKAACWEIWCKSKNRVLWVSPGIENTLDEQEPYLKLEGFFPCPRPAFGTLQRRSMMPVPDFVFYRDQVEEINELTARISALSESLRLKGFYNAGASDLGDAIEAALKSQDNNAILVPVSAAAMGDDFSKAIVWIPVREVAEVIVQLIELRKQLIEDVYEITGLSDIMRGSTDANETLGAQQLKSQYGSVRIRDRQGELIRIARDVARMAGEIMAENFDPKTFMEMTQMDLPTEERIAQQVQEIIMQAQQVARQPQAMQMAQENPQLLAQAKQAVEGQINQLRQQITVEKIVELFRSQRMRPFVLDIETDSTIQPDEDAEKQRRGEFLTALGNVMQQLAPMVQAQPEAAPFAGEMLKFAVAPFRAGREVEAAIDDFVEGMKKKAGQPQPNPEAEKMKMEAEAKKAEMDMTMKAKQAEFAMKENAEKAKAERENAKAIVEMQIKQMDLEIKREELSIKREESALKREDMAFQAEAKKAETVMKLDAAHEANEMKAEAARESAKLKKEAKADA